jgi:hypothetical protein
MRIRVQGFKDQKLRKKYSWKILNILLIKTCIRWNVLTVLYFSGPFLPAWIRIQSGSGTLDIISMRRAFSILKNLTIPANKTLGNFDFSNMEIITFYQTRKIFPRQKSHLKRSEYDRIWIHKTAFFLSEYSLTIIIVKSWPQFYDKRCFLQLLASRESSGTCWYIWTRNKCKMIAIIGTWEMSPLPPDESYNSGTSVKESHMLQLLTTDPTNTLTDRIKKQC